MAVPHFYFDLYDGDVVMDREGRHCVDLDEAMAWATQEARNIASADVKQGSLVTGYRIDVLNTDRLRLGSVSFGEAVIIS